MYVSGRSPNDELPSKPFGMIPDELKYPPIEKELGLRSGFSDKERKFSEYTIMKQNETERAIKEEEGRRLGIDDDAAFYDEGEFLSLISCLACVCVERNCRHHFYFEIKFRSSFLLMLCHFPEFESC
jgi:hypothetical protein